MMECKAESTCMFSGGGMKRSSSDSDFDPFAYFWDEPNSFLNCGGNGETLFVSQNLTPNQSSIPVTMDSYSICGNLSYGSPVSANEPKSNDVNDAKGGTTESSHEQSDVDEQSTEPIDLKRQRRKLSNRDSARRSRRRKQAHLAELELQVEQLRVEKASLYNQCSDVAQMHHDASTNNLLLKSRVEELRAMVRLAKDKLARSSMSCSSNQLLRNQLINSYNLHRMANVMPTNNVCQDDSSYAGMTNSGNSTFGLGSVDMGNGSLNNGINSDAISCVTDTWY